MAKVDEIYIGSDLKLNVHIEPIGTFDMDSFNFSVKLVAYSPFGKSDKSVTISKDKATRLDNGDYMVWCNTQELGLGHLYAIITCLVPDAQIGKNRTEIVRVDTNIDIIDVE